MKKEKIKKVVNKIVEVTAIVGLTLVINNITTNTDMTKELNKVNNSIVSATEIKEVKKELTLNDNTILHSDIENTFKNEIQKVLKDTNIKINYEGKSPSGNIYYDLSNNATVLYDIKNNIYELYISELGDWEIPFNNVDDLIKCLLTYIDNTNYVDDTNNLVYSYQVQESTQKKNNIISTNNIDKQINTIKENNTTSSTLQNTTNSTISNSYNDDDYKRYLEYKNSLIEEYGLEIYDLMNQEIGVNSEEESFQYFMEYGI